MSENSLDRRENNVIARQEEICERGRIFGEFNKAWISGIIEKNFELSHENSWEKFYKTKVCVKRLSGTEDSIPIVVSEILITDLFDKTLKGKYIEAGGQFRSRKIEGEDNRKHLELFLFAKDINICDTESDLTLFLALHGVELQCMRDNCIPETKLNCMGGYKVDSISKDIHLTLKKESIKKLMRFQ